MKRLPVLLAACLALSCQACRSVGEVRGIRNGDLIFVGIPADYDSGEGSMAEAIGAATAGTAELNIIHVAIAEVRNDSVWVIDATIKHNVDRHPLDTFVRDFTLKDGSLPVFEVKRLKSCKDASRYVENAKRFIGEPYDVTFLPDNGAKYCSELVRDSYVLEDGSYIFGAAPMNFKDSAGEMPVYWERLFSRLGIPVPQGVLGTNPKAMSEEEVLESVENVAFCRIP